MSNDIVIRDIVNNYTDPSGLAKVNEVLNDALSHSASIFSKFLSKKVAFSISGINESIEPLFHQTDMNLKVVISDLKGDLKGRSYLVFNNQDCKSLVETCLPGDLSQNAEMQEAIIMELDNILTAAVVTNLSNTLKINSYAYVPALSETTPKKLIGLIENDHKNDCFLITVKTSFTVDNVDLSPLFIWALELKLIDIIIEKK